MVTKRYLLILLVSILLFVGCIALDTIYFSNSRITINQQNIEDSKIPESLNNMKIGIFSDLEYGKYTDSNKVDKLIDKLNSQDCDSIFFLGDLFEKDYKPTSDEIKGIGEKLKKLTASKGKFAVLGDFDNEEIAKELLTIADFEIIEGNVLKLHNGLADYINVVGLRNLVNQDNDYNSLYSNIKADTYTIALCHTSGVNEYLPIDVTDLLISGHSHGYQINYPIIGPYKEFGYDSLPPGKHIINGLSIIITAGVGCINKPYRLFSNSEIIIIKLHN